MEKKKLQSLKEVVTGFRDLRNDMVFHSGGEQTRRKMQLMTRDKQVTMATEGYFYISAV